MDINHWLPVLRDKNKVLGYTQIKRLVGMNVHVVSETSVVG